ncbi:Putative HTH-type transcriptional regulator [Magnetospira sp. QH-2]|nr:Putative HTH-type transcriptional regulator [Magnetospira sp. QH-2]
MGSRLRKRRIFVGMSQEKLGEAVGLTFQQIQKYERGANRIGASRLYEFSRILDVSVSYFFEAMSDNVASDAGQVPAGEPIIPDAGGTEALFERLETLRLVHAYYRIPDTESRKRLLDLIKALASADGEEASEAA